MGDTKTYLTGVYDADGNQLDSYDLTMGRLETRQKVTHHDAVEGVEEQGHYEVVAQYPNGGKDVAWVVDVPGVAAQEAYDEIMIYDAYIPYTTEELLEMERQRTQPTMDEQVAEIRAALDALMGGIADANS